MKNKDLRDILESMNPNDDICINVYDVNTGACMDSTYDIGFTQNEFKQLVLEVNVSVKRHAI